MYTVHEELYIHRELHVVISNLLLKQVLDYYTMYVHVAVKCIMFHMFNGFFFQK